MDQILRECKEKRGGKRERGEEEGPRRNMNRACRGVLLYWGRVAKHQSTFNAITPPRKHLNKEIIKQ
jgi:hypothetical protein